MSTRQRVLAPANYIDELIWNGTIPAFVAHAFNDRRTFRRLNEMCIDIRASDV